MQDDIFIAPARSRRKFLAAAVVLLVLLAAALLLALGAGEMPLRAEQTLGILRGKLFGDTAALDAFRPGEIAVIWDIRLPRALCGLLVGMGLAISGVIFQSLLRNPLADPYTLGVSSGAAFGASLSIYLGIAYGLVVPAVPLACLCALVTLAAVLLIARKGGGLLSSSLVIAGIIVSAILSSGISMLKMLAGENVAAIVFWLMGSLSAKTLPDAALLAPVVFGAGALACLFANDLNVMTLGDDAARSLGVNVRRTRLLFLLLASCITAVCVAVSGIIGFVGLIVPHLLRFSLTSDNRVLLPLSALSGGLLLLLADNASRLLSAGEIPVGVLTTLLGGPFFIFVFLRRPGGGDADG